VRKNDLLQKFLKDQEDLFLEADNKLEEEAKRFLIFLTYCCCVTCAFIVCFSNFKVLNFLFCTFLGCLKRGFESFFDSLECKY
jgi:hypothetical protein